MKIEGKLYGGNLFTPRPYVQAWIKLSSGADGNVNFLIDTGADITTLHPVDAQRFGITNSYLQGKQSSESTGIGGRVEYAREDITLTTLTTNGDAHVQEMEIQVGPRGEDYKKSLKAGTLSVLGRDFLKNCILVLDYRKGKVFIELP